MNNQYKPVIGLEIHVELSTKSKMFCQCSADYFGKKPNIHTCPVCLGLPGALPVPNLQAVEWTILIGQALNCTINKVSKFDRKHYFYPDLPKGYQISQYDEPFCVKGYLVIAIPPRREKQSANWRTPRNDERKIKIRRVHLEEDTGKLIHHGEDTLVDFNRSGVPLVEIVTEPDFETADEVKAFGEELQSIVRALGVSSADMEKGSMRLEPNISVRAFTVHGSPLRQSFEGQAPFTDSETKPVGTGLDLSDLPNYKVEIKNINSFNFASRAIEYEVKRHIEILEKGETPLQETRGYNETKGITVGQRSKEEAHDYRYFPEPDIPPLTFTDEYLKNIKDSLLELPSQKLQKYTQTLGVRYEDALQISRDIKLSDFYEQVISKIKDQKSKLQIKIQKEEQQIANFLVNKKIERTLTPEEFVQKAIDLMTPKTTDIDLLHQTIEQVLKENEKVVNDYKNGKHNAIMFLVGKVMKEMKGKADATIVREYILKRLK